MANLCLYAYPPATVRRADLKLFQKNAATMTDEELVLVNNLTEVVNQFLVGSSTWRGCKKLQVLIKRRRKISEDFIKAVKRAVRTDSFASERLEDLMEWLEQSKGMHVPADVY